MIETRALSKDDRFSDLITLSREFFTDYEAHHEDFFKIEQLTNQDVILYFNSFCGQASRRAFIALDGESIVGYITVYVKEQASYWQIKRIGEISGLMIKNGYRRLGIARKLLGEAIKFFSAQGVVYYIVYTAVANQTGLDFYRKCGLVPLYETLIGEVQASF